jgi:hypothetical protein
MVYGLEIWGSDSGRERDTFLDYEVQSGCGICPIKFWIVKLTADLYLMPMSKMCAALPQRPYSPLWYGGFGTTLL